MEGFIKILIQNDASTHKWRVGRFASFCKILIKRPWMRGRTICVIFGHWVSWVKIYDEAPINEGSDTLRHFAKPWWNACKRLFRSIMCDRFIQNAFEGLQNLNFHFFIKFDIPLRNKKLGLYYLQEKNAFFQILKTWRVKVTHESIFASKYDF